MTAEKLENNVKVRADSTPLSEVVHRVVVIELQVRLWTCWHPRRQSFITLFIGREKGYQLLRMRQIFLTPNCETNF